MSSTLFLGNPAQLSSMFGSDEWGEASGSGAFRNVTTVEDALPILTANDADSVVIIGFDTADDLGDILEQVQSVDASIPMIFVNERLSAAEAVRLTRAGAWGCFGAGDSLDCFRDSIERAGEERRRAALASRDSSERWRSILVGGSSAMETVAGGSIALGRILIVLALLALAAWALWR